jgi:hypothetical protein
MRTSSPDEISEIAEKSRKRRLLNIGLRILLAIMMVVYLVPAVRFLVIGQVPFTVLSVSSPPDWLFPVFGSFCAINIVCLIALFWRKKWGFWGLLALLVPTVLLKFRLFMSLSSVLIEIIGTLLILVVFYFGRKTDHFKVEGK